MPECCPKADRRFGAAWSNAKERASVWHNKDVHPRKTENVTTAAWMASRDIIAPGQLCTVSWRVRPFFFLFGLSLYVFETIFPVLLPPEKGNIFLLCFLLYNFQNLVETWWFEPKKKNEAQPIYHPSSSISSRTENGRKFPTHCGPFSRYRDHQWHRKTAIRRRKTSAPDKHERKLFCSRSKNHGGEPKRTEPDTDVTLQRLNTNHTPMFDSKRRTHIGFVPDKFADHRISDSVLHKLTWP